ncbi:unnamed protein product [Prunus armeniaca]|uniref:Uncharacterized protein n=1 Tax=Prunus armeniaca TaxID=36596 RepID=A0A6J5VNK8_PRUAR|nr:unnamed protein product [Prunus armeniaca]
MGRFRGVSNPLHVELLALREGLHLAAKWPGLRICLERCTGDDQLFNCVADRLAHYPLLAHVPADEVEWWDSPPIWLSDTYRLSKISVEV